MVMPTSHSLFHNVLRGTGIKVVLRSKSCLLCSTRTNSDDVWGLLKEVFEFEGLYVFIGYINDLVRGFKHPS